MSNPITPPGWHHDAQGVMRWWDGQQWTEHVAHDLDRAPAAVPQKRHMSKGKKVALGATAGTLALFGIVGALAGSTTPTTHTVDAASASPSAEPTHSAAYLAAQARQEAANQKAADAAVALQASRDAKAAAAAAAAAAAWKAGYDEIADGVAVDLLGKHSNCPDYTQCIQAKVVVRDGCSNLYIEYPTIDASRNKIGFTNDVLTGLAAGDHGLMTFAITDTNATGVDPSGVQVTCS